MKPEALERKLLVDRIMARAIELAGEKKDRRLAGDVFLRAQETNLGQVSAELLLAFAELTYGARATILWDTLAEWLRAHPNEPIQLLFLKHREPPGFVVLSGNAELRGSDPTLAGAVVTALSAAGLVDADPAPAQPWSPVQPGPGDPAGGVS